jgi:hypothetical protein
MENCIIACNNCQIILGKNHPLWQSCFNCEKICIFFLTSYINNRYLKNQIIKLCMDSCRICILESSKYRKINKECLECYNACIKCIDYCQNILI